MKTNIFKRKNIGGVLTLAMTLMLSLSVLLSMTPSSTTYGERENNENWVTIGEIYNDEAEAFDGDRIMDLIKALTGERFYSSLKTAAKEKKTSADFRSINDNKNVSVYFGGIKWDAVYLTTAEYSGENTKAGDIILDLWRSSDTLIASTQTEVHDVASYAYFWCDRSTDLAYPSNMYSTSVIRVEMLNAGGQYSQNSSIMKAYTQNKDNQYARFTMSKKQGVENSLTEYLAKPSEVGYQEKEYDEEIMKSFYGPAEKDGWETGVTYYYFPNDAYGTLDTSDDGPKWYDVGTNMDYSSKGNEETAYNAWKNDYLWLPSLTETGMSNGGQDGVGDGVWDTDAILRSAKSGLGKSYCWLRSGEAYRADRAYLLDDSGNRNQLVVSGDTSGHQKGCGVRPALHLNLTAAAEMAILDKDNWTGDTKTYSPNGVTWEILNSDMIEISSAEGSGDEASWWDSENHIITANKVGTYELHVKPKSGTTWQDGTHDEITVPYIVEPDNMRVIFNNGLQGEFNNEKLEKRREVYYSSGASIELKLPDPMDKRFPISWKDVWNGDLKDKIDIKYIVKKYTEEEYDSATVNRYLIDLTAGRQTDEEWKDYDNLDEANKTANEPLVHYAVFFKAVDIEGNHKPCYDYFEVHTIAEHLKITLTDAAMTSLENGVEYGDVAHTQEAFKKDIISGIEKVMATGAGVGNSDVDRTKSFIDNIDQFKFYLRKDNSILEGNVEDDGVIYTIEDDGIYLHEDDSSSTAIDNLPLGTYHLYVDVKNENASKYITLEWSNGRPQFKVLPRKIKVSLTFSSMIYGQEPIDWVTAKATRASEGKDGTWYAQNEAMGDDDLDILDLSYILQETNEAPNKTTSAGTYTVLPTCSNNNYDVEFLSTGSDNNLTFTVNKATYDMSSVSFSDITVPYDGEEHSIEITGNLPNGVSVTYEGNGKKEVGTYTIVATFKGDEQNYNAINSMSATLTIVKTDSLVKRLEYTFPSSNQPNVIVESMNGFDSTMKLICDGVDNISRTFMAWENDEISYKYTLKMMKNDEDIPFNGKVTIRLLIPRELKDKDFALQNIDGESLNYTLDGDYVVFETEGVSSYVFTMDGMAFLPMLYSAALISILSIGTLIVTAVIIRKYQRSSK